MAADRAALHAHLSRLVAAAYVLGRDRRLRWNLDVDPIDFS